MADSFPRVEPLAGAADLDGVLAVEEASFHNPTTRVWYEEELKRPEVCKIFVLRTAERPVAGFVAFWHVLDEMHINNMAIDPTLRRQGLGHRLLGEVLERATHQGMRRVTLEVRRSNEPARRLYAALGFRELAVRASYYTHPVEDALVLGLELNRLEPGGRVRE